MQVSAIHSASRRAWLTTPYFVPGEAALMALTSAALRGVDVRLLVPRRSDSIVVSAAARSYFAELIAAGVKVWEYKARMLHSKTLLVDDHCGMIGTANFDNRSFRLNFEVMAVVYGPALAGPLAEAVRDRPAQFAGRCGHKRRGIVPAPARRFDCAAVLAAALSIHDDPHLSLARLRNLRRRTCGATGRRSSRPSAPMPSSTRSASR